MTSEQRLELAREKRERFDAFALAAASKHTLSMIFDRLGERYPSPDDQMGQALDQIDGAILALQIWLSQQSEDITP